MDNPQATQIEIGWLAGILDGEGYIGLLKTRDYRKPKERLYINPQMHICNTDEDIVLRARDIVRKLGANTYLRVSQHQYNSGKNKKTVYRIQCKNMTNLIKILTPVVEQLTGQKKVRAEYVLAFCLSRKGNYIPGSHNLQPYTEKELELFELCQPLSKRGASETIRRADLKRSKIYKLQKEREKKETNLSRGECQTCGKQLGHGQKKYCSQSCYWQVLRST